MNAPDHGWSHQLFKDPDGTLRVEIVDEDGASYPVARQMTQAQAQRLLAAVAAESASSGRRVAEVIRDYRFMAGTVLAIKQAR